MILHVLPCTSNNVIPQPAITGGTITYDYYPDGKVKNITAPGGAVTSMQYNDAARNQTLLSDPSAGNTSYTYNSRGQLLTQTDNQSRTTTYTYHSDGRVNTIASPEGTTTYNYNLSTKQLVGIDSPNNVSRSYGYDSMGRINSTGDNIDNSSFSTTFTYDSYGRLETKNHNSVLTETYNYNNQGYMSSISAGGATRYTVNSMNAREQLTGATYGGSIAATYGFDSYGYPTSTQTGTIQDYRYSFDPYTGNLSYRQNYLRSKMEYFGYDNLDRLTSVTGPQNLTMTFQDNGNINTKSDIGSTPFQYGIDAGPYSLSKVTSSSGVIPTAAQNVSSYNSFQKVVSIGEDGNTASFIYNADHERARMIQTGSNSFTRWYHGGSFMRETNSSGTKDYVYLGGDAYTAPVAAVIENGTPKYHYLLRDYLGNITHDYNSDDATTREYSFDAWGRRRSPADWGYDVSSEPELFAGRGFTSHEFLKEFNVYNMNGRLYDPLVGRFLSVDNVVQDPSYSQSYNRYSYCLNNPLKYVDPEGYYWDTRIPDGPPPRPIYDSGEPALGTGGGGDWFSAYMSATADGYTGGASVFMNSYYGQLRSPSFNGTMTFTYRSGSANWTEKGTYYGTDENGNSFGIITESPVVAPVYKTITVGIGIDSNRGYSIDNAVNSLNANSYLSYALAKAAGDRASCARFIRWSLEAGFGLKRDALKGKLPVPAREYGPFLVKLGFTQVTTTDFLKGDIAVIQGYPGGTSDSKGIPYGHIQMYNGTQWLSNFNQNNFWPGNNYQRYQPAFQIYRMNP